MMDIFETDIVAQFKIFKEVFLKSKKYWLIYIVLTTFLFFSTVSKKNILHPKFEILIFCLVIVLGIFCIVFYFMNKSDKDLYKVAFVVILCFGLICSLVVPICDVSDEREHFARAELTSEGAIFPHWTGDDLGLERLWNENGVYNNETGFETIGSIHFFWDEIEKTVFDTSHDTDKINYSSTIVDSAFQQNPFYGYLPQAIGILVAKLLDLNVIWMLWLGRIFNLLCYAGLVSLAIKKTPYLKIPLIAVACIPITIYQAASVSIDSMIFGLGILAVAYYIFMSQADRSSLNQKEIIIFSTICLLLGLCKLPYLAFIFLLLFVPRDNFENKKYMALIYLLCIGCIAVVGLLWSHYSQPLLLHSWRSYYTQINSTQQINFIIHHPFNILTFFKQIFTNDLAYILQGFFKFFSAAHHPDGHYINQYPFISMLIEIFLVFILLAYPIHKKFDSKTRIGALIVIFIIYVGTSIIQLLTWANVGEMGLGMTIRYFIPLFALVPIIFNFNIISQNNPKFDNFSMIFIICFLATLVLAFTTKYY